MPYEETEDAFIIPNSEFDISEFTKLSNGNTNRNGTTNFGNGIKANMGLLKGNGRTAPIEYIFDKNKWTLADAEDWVGKFKGSSMVDIGEIEEFNNEMWITSNVTKINEKFDDGRTIVAIDVPGDRDIPVRDLHSKGYEEVVGLTNSDNINFNHDGKMTVKWKVISDKLEKMVKSAKYPKKLFQFSPELSKPKFGSSGRRSGVLSGIAITDNPSWSGSENLEIKFEKLESTNEPVFVANDNALNFAKELINEGKYIEGDVPANINAFNKETFSKYHLAYNENASDKENSYCLPFGIDGNVCIEALQKASEDAKQFEDKALFERINALNNLIQEDVKLSGEKELELQMQIKDLEIEKETFERDLTASKKEVESFEKQIETFEKEVKDLKDEVADVTEKFNNKEKDYNDLKKDHDEAVKTIEKFENKVKTDKIEEVFELGVSVGRYEKDKKDEVVKELFEVSDDRLDEKIENFQFMQKMVQKNHIPGVPGGKGESSGRDSFLGIFE